MIVTSLESQKKDPSRVSLFVEGSFFCGISTNTLAKYTLYVGKVIDQETLDELFLSELESRFFDRAMSFLDRSPKTEKQVRQYLRELAYKKKGDWFDSLSNELLSVLTENVVKKLLEYEYIDDERYAELFVTSRTKHKPRGKDILVMELISKGVAKETALKTVDTLVLDEYSLLKDTYKKKFKDEKIEMGDRKKIDYLRRKGFDWDLIEKYINDESSE